jgi:hypothetical protein
LAARLKTSAATFSFSSPIVPILCPQALQQMTESSAGPCPRSKLFLPHTAQVNSIRIARLKHADHAAMLPQFAFDGQF